MGDQTLDIRTWHMAHHASNIGNLISEFWLIQSSFVIHFSDFHNCCLNYHPCQISYKVPPWDFKLKLYSCKNSLSVIDLVWHCIRFPISFLNWTKLEILDFSQFWSQLSSQSYFVQILPENFCWIFMLGTYFSMAFTVPDTLFVFKYHFGNGQK